MCSSQGAKPLLPGDPLRKWTTGWWDALRSRQKLPLGSAFQMQSSLYSRCALVHLADLAVAVVLCEFVYLAPC